MGKSKETLHCQTCTTRGESVFCDLVQPRLEEMDKNKTTNDYKPHQIIFYEGNQPYGVYCVSKGKIKIYKTDAEGHQQIVRLAGTGDILGYRALLAGDTYEATAETLEDSTICFFEKGTFFHILETHPPTAFQVMALLAKDLGASEKQTLSVTHKNIRERLAELLLIFKNRYGKKSKNGILLDISLSREEMAEFIGTTQESLIRTLSDFKEEALISVDGRSICINDISKLTRIAQLTD